MTSQPETQKNKHNAHPHDRGHPWVRIANLKILLIVISLGFFTINFYVGYIVLILMHVQVASGWLWLDVVPWESLASACLGSFLVAFAYEWFIRKETDAELTQTLDRYFQSHEQVIGSEIARAMLINRDVMKDILSSHVVDDVIRAGLEVRLGDAQLARDVYDSQLSQILTYKERRSNFRCNVYLAPLKNGGVSEEVKLKYYEAYIDVRYDAYLYLDAFHFTCVASIDDYWDLLRHSGHELWMTEPTREFPNLDVSVYDVESITVSTQTMNIPLNIRRETIGNQFVITADHVQLASMIGQQVKVYYRYKVKLQKRGHLFMTHIPCPTHNVVVELDYADTDIHFVNVLDFFGCKIKPRILYIPSEKKRHRVEVEANGWVLPMSGIVFAWVLRSEMTSDFVKLMSDSSAAN